MSKLGLGLTGVDMRTTLLLRIRTRPSLWLLLLLEVRRWTAVGRTVACSGTAWISIRLEILLLPGASSLRVLVMRILLLHQKLLLLLMKLLSLLHCGMLKL